MEDTVTIESFDKTVERYPSPVFYKIVGKILFIIPMTPPEENQIYGKKFLLRSVPDPEGSFQNENFSEVFEIQVPSKNEFDIDELWRDYINYLINKKTERNSLLHQYNIAKGCNGQELCFLRASVKIESL